MEERKVLWLKRRAGTPWLFGIEVGRIYLWDEPIGWWGRIGLGFGELTW